MKKTIISVIMGIIIGMSVAFTVVALVNRPAITVRANAPELNTEKIEAYIAETYADREYDKVVIDSEIMSNGSVYIYYTVLNDGEQIVCGGKPYSNF